MAHRRDTHRAIIKGHMSQLEADELNSKHHTKYRKPTDYPTMLGIAEGSKRGVEEWAAERELYYAGRGNTNLTIEVSKIPREPDCD